MRVVEKSDVDALILEGVEKLKSERDRHIGQWDRYYVPEIFNSMIAEFETLRKEVEALVIEVS